MCPLDVTPPCRRERASMRLYVRVPAPSAVKVEIFAIERGGAPLEIVDTAQLARDQILRMNPLGTVPILEIAPGCFISESLTICQFLDEVNEGRPLFGNTPDERAQIAMWERRAELRLLIPSLEYVHHTHPAFAGHWRQHPEWARDEAAKSIAMLELIAERLESSLFLAGDSLSAADLTAYLGYRGLRAFGAVGQIESVGFRRWEREVGERPSMGPLRQLTGALEQAPRAGQAG